MVEQKLSGSREDFDDLLFLDLNVYSLCLGLNFSLRGRSTFGYSF